MQKQKKIGKVEPVQKTWLNKDEAMAYLGCSERFLQTIRDKAEISFSRFGSKMYWYELKSLDRFIERNRVV